jgi:hypothetical protein
MTAALCAVGVLLIAACSSSSTTSHAAAQSKPSPKTTGSAAAHSSASPTHSTAATHATSPSPAATQKIPCKQADQLRTSLTSLSHTKVSASSASTLSKDLKNVQSDVADLKAHATGSFATDLNGLSASMDQIKKAAGMLSSNPATAVKDLTAGVASLKAKSGPVIADINASCPKT